MPLRSLELIILRNDYYYRCYRHVKTIVAILTLMFLMLVALVFMQHSALSPGPRYFPTTPDGRLIYMPELNINHLKLSEQLVAANTGAIIGMPSPVMTYDELAPFGENALILYWAYRAVMDMFDYDYVHYRTIIQRASKYFTPLGHTNFIQALTSSKNLETVKARRAVVIPEIVGNVELRGTRMFEDRFVWDVSVPIKLTYASVMTPDPLIQNLRANMSIARVSTLRSPFYGLAIYSLNFELGATIGDTK